MDVRKQFDIVVRELRENGGQILINTAAVDRDRDRVLPAGVRTDNYMKNPVVQWGHNYHEPWATIGRTLSIERRPEGLVADFELRPAANDQDPQHIVRLLWQGGWIKAASVGFINLESSENDVGGRDYQEWELLEWSLVPIPANQEALRLAAKAFGDEPEGSRTITLDCIGCGASYESSATLASLILTGQAVQFCEKCVEWVSTHRGEAARLTRKAAERNNVGDPEENDEKDAPGGSGASTPLSAGSDLVAWIRQLTVYSNLDREQTLFACFHAYTLDIPEDATQLDCDEDGELVEVPHRDAGKTVARKSVDFVPPLAFYDEGWGEDAVFSTSGKAQPDDELVAPWDDEWEVLELSDILLSLPVPTSKAWGGHRVGGMELCKLTRRSVRVASEMISRRLGKAQGKSVIPYSAHSSTPPADEGTAWDAGAARARLREWAGGDDWDPARYRQGFAFVDGEPDLLTSYKGPHHDIVGGAFRAVWRGVSAAMGSLVFGARGGRIEDEGDRRGVYNHLAKHYAQWDKPAPEFREMDEAELREAFPALYVGQGDEGIPPEELDALAREITVLRQSLDMDALRRELKRLKEVLR